MIHPPARYDPGSIHNWAPSLGSCGGLVADEGEKQRAIPFSGMARIVLAVAYFPRPFARGVSSALWRFTSVFGMGTGGATTL